jgi:Tfp pilus assembly protein PilO
MRSTNPRQANRLGWALHAAGAAVVALVLGAFYALVYQSLVHQQAAAATRIGQMQQLLKKSSDVQRQHRQLRDQLTDLQHTVGKVRERLPEQVSRDQFEQELRDRAQAAGLRSIDVRHQPPEVMATHSQAEVEFGCDGSYASICQFLAELEKLTNLTRISRLTLDSVPNSGTNHLQGVFVLYYAVTTHDKDYKGSGQ